MKVKKRAIPQGYMTVGEIARKMGVTVRTMQYYDKQGLLQPSAQSEGGLRLYTQQDIVKLYQIQSMKYIGFSLEDIKAKLLLGGTSKDMQDILAKQAEEIRKEINALQGSLEVVEKLSEEVLNMETVDWAKCADIIAVLQAGSSSYRAIKHFGDNLTKHVHNCFDKKNGERIMNMFEGLSRKIIRIKQDGFSPESKQGQELAKAWWDMVLDFTEGDMSLLPELSKLAGTLSESNTNGKLDVDFIDKALTTYFANDGYNPFHDKELQI